MPRSQKPRRRRLLAAALAAAGAVTVGTAGLVAYHDRNIERIPDLDLGADRPGPAPEIPKDALNLLLVGSDSREGLAAGEAGAEQVEGQRADTVILAHLYAGRDVVELVSFPRDSWVEIPAHPDSETGRPVPARRGKLNSAFQYGGRGLLIETVEGIAGTQIDHYAEIDFNGFKDVVERLDGVEVCLAEPAKEPLSGIDLPAGRQVVRGDQALAFVRQRHGLPGGDLGRIGRQHQFLGSAAREILSPRTLLDPVRLNGLVSDITAAVKVDDGLGLFQIRDLALRARSFTAGGVVFTTLPVEDGDATREGQSVVLLDEPEVEGLFDRLRRDVPPPGVDGAVPSESAAPPPEAPPSALPSPTSGTAPVSPSSEPPLTAERTVC